MARDLFGLEGQIVDGQVRVDEAIGEGGFSVVYKGHHLGLGEPVAVKCLKLPQALSASEADAFSLRFRDESRLAYRLSQGNLNIVRSITSGTTVAPATGALLPYMALEWLEGRSLAREFGDRRPHGRPFGLDEAVRLFEPAVQAIDFAHSQGVIHRDIKPGNLFLATTREGVRMKVLDFGLAKILHDDTAVGVVPSVKTMNNVLMCSPSYGAPEQFEAELGPIGPWTDVYSLALVFVEGLANKKARHATSMTEGAVLALSKTYRPTPRALGVDLGDAVEAVLARAVSVEPAERPATAGELWRLLRGALLTSPPADAVDRTVRELHRPQLARVRGERGESKGAAAGEGAPPATPPPATPPPGAAGFASTVRMDSSPARPWEAVRAANQARIARSRTPPPSAPSRVPVIVAVAVLFFVALGAAAFLGALYFSRR